MIKYIEFGAFGVVNVIIGSLLIALATDNYGGDTFGEVFLLTVGIALLLFGVGVAIAAIATYRAKSD